MHKQHPLLIPTGYFCYSCHPATVVPIVRFHSDRIGRDMREGDTGDGEKAVLCPYWFRNESGSVRCDFLKYEEEFQGNLWDMQKACGVRPPPTPTWAITPEDAARFTSYPPFEHPLSRPRRQGRKAKKKAEHRAILTTHYQKLAALFVPADPEENI